MGQKSGWSQLGSLLDLTGPNQGADRTGGSSGCSRENPHPRSFSWWQQGGFRAENWAEEMDGCWPDHIPQQNWPTPCSHQPRKPNHNLWSRTSRNWLTASSFLTFCPHLQIRTKQRKLNMLPYPITFLVVPPPASPGAHQGILKAFSSYSQQSLLPTESSKHQWWWLTPFP